MRPQFVNSYQTTGKHKKRRDQLSNMLKKNFTHTHAYTHVFVQNPVQFDSTVTTAAAAVVAVASTSDEVSDSERSAARAKGARRLLKEASNVVQYVDGTVELVDVIVLQKYLV